MREMVKKTKRGQERDPSTCSFLSGVYFLNVCSAGFPIPVSFSDTETQSSTTSMSLHLFLQLATGKALSPWSSAYSWPLNLLSALGGGFHCFSDHTL